MEAKDLDEAIALQNQVEFGLTGGIHSLEISEVERWLDEVQIGNAYVNRGITGAIVQRQPFGGWKKSSVGLGSKVSGPNYVMLFGRWSDSTDIASAAQLPMPAGAAGDLLRSASEKNALTEAGLAWLKAAAASDAQAWEAEFGTPTDPTGLGSEANIFRYLPTSVVLRVGADAEPHHALRTLLAGHRAGASAVVSVDKDASKEVRRAVKLAAKAFGIDVEKNETEDEFAAALAEGRYDQGLGARVRAVGSLSRSVWEAVSHRPEIALLDDPITASGRVEIRHWVKEQSVSMTLHRFGNSSSQFKALAERLKGQ